MSLQAGDHCPRCGAGFHCGINDAEPCACSTLKLDVATLAELRGRYAGCLCLACLRQVALVTLPAISTAAKSSSRP